jgi:hypothetical protein
MRAFLTACVAMVVVGAAGYFILNSIQEPAGSAYATDGARTDPSWSWRTAGTGSGAQQCEPRQIWQWFFVDFRRPAGEPGVCSDSQ